jgi:hypothetical protein
MIKYEKPIVIMLEERIEKVTQQMCEHYCKWTSQYKDPDELMKDKCENCPLCNL